MIVVVVLMFAGLLVLPAASLLASRDVVNRWRALRADLRSRRIERFSSGRSPEEEIEVLLHSGLVFLLHGTRPSHRMSASVYEAVAPPESTSHWALPAELASRLPDALRERSVVQRRRLTPGELDELERHRRRLWRPSAGLVGFGVWAGLGVIAATGSLITGDFASWRRQYLVAFLGVAGATIWQIVRYGRMLSFSRALGRDGAYGWAIVIDNTTDSPSRVEVLPESGALWTADGTPSDWRMVR